MHQHEHKEAYFNIHFVCSSDEKAGEWGRCHFGTLRFFVVLLLSFGAIRCMCYLNAIFGFSFEFSLSLVVSATLTVVSSGQIQWKRATTHRPAKKGSRYLLTMKHGQNKCIHICVCGLLCKLSVYTDGQR